MTSSLETQVPLTEYSDEDDFISSSDEEFVQPPRKRARVVISHVRQCQRVHPSSAYHGTQAHSRATRARFEEDVLIDFLVSLEAAQLI